MVCHAIVSFFTHWHTICRLIKAGPKPPEGPGQGSGQAQLHRQEQKSFEASGIQNCVTILFFLFRIF